MKTREEALAYALSFENIWNEREEIIMIRHILFWKYTDAVKTEHREKEALEFMQDSVSTMNGHIDGLIQAQIEPNLAGGEYDLVFYAELKDEAALRKFRDHPLHVAHRERCKDLVTGRLCGDIRA